MTTQAGLVRTRGRWIVLALCGFLLSCGGPPSVVTHGGTSEMSLIGCLTALDARGIAFESAGPVRSGACGIDGPVRLPAGTLGLNQSVLLSCRAALALALYDQHVIQPLAAAHFGQPVTQVRHSGGYVCRTIRGSNRLSRHAFGDAIDIHALRLADGRVMSIQDDWYDRNAEGRFLRAIGAGACQVFDTVLGPSYDAAHRDHLHLDLNRSAFCRP